jgi:hypothetical protein
LGKRLDPLHRCFAHLLVIELALHQTVQTDDLARAADGDQLHLARVAGLEADRSAGRDVEPHAVRGSAIEGEVTVDLEEMKVRSDLHRPVAAVADLDAFRRPTRVQLDWVGREEVFTRFHGRRLLTLG